MSKTFMEPSQIFQTFEHLDITCMKAHNKIFNRKVSNFIFGVMVPLSETESKFENDGLAPLTAVQSKNAVCAFTKLSRYFH